MRARSSSSPASELPTLDPSLTRSTIVMAMGTGLSRITGLLRVAVMAATLGVSESRVADTYNLANTTPNVLYQLALGGILSATFVPVLVQVRREQGREEAWRVGSSLMTVAVALLGALALVGMVAAPWVMRLYTLGVHDPAVREQQQRVGTALLVTFMPQVVFYGLGAMMSGLLNANRRFGVPAVAPALNNLVVIATGVAFALLAGRRTPQLGALGLGPQLLLGLGTTAGVVAMTAVQVPSLRRIGFRYRFAWELGHPAIRKLARLSAFTVAFAVTNQLAMLVVPVLANQVQGGYTAFSAAFIMFQLPHGIFAVAVMTALLPPMSEHAVAGDWAAFRAALSRGVRTTMAVLMPASVGYVVLAGPIVALLLQHGVVGSESVMLVTGVLVALAVGLLPFSLFQLGLRAWYALQETRVPFLVNLVVVLVDVLVDVASFQLLPSDAWRVSGLGAGNTAAYAAGTLLLLLGLRRRLGGLDGARMARTLARVLAASLAMGAVARVVAGGLWALLGSGLLGQAAAVGAAVAAGLAAYLAAARVFRVEELHALLANLRRRTPAQRSGGGG